MDPVILHEDGSACQHEGLPKSYSETGPATCPKGLVVTHVLVNGKMMTIEEASVVFVNLSKAFAEAFKPITAAFARMSEELGKAVISLEPLKTEHGES